MGQGSNDSLSEVVAGGIATHVGSSDLGSAQELKELVCLEA